jgi:hypothetical protein
MPDENRVFDVTKPKDVSPSATSKPVIVGHQPQTSDPMVKDNDKPAEEPTYIKVVDDSPESDGPQNDDHSALDNSPVPPVAAAIFSEPSPEPPDTPEKDEPADYLTEKAAPEPAGQPEPVAEPAVFPEAPVAEPADEPTPPDDEAAAMPATAGNSPPPHIEELHFSEKNLKRSWWKPALLVLLLLLIGAYLAIDSGLVRGYSHLPFHIFKQKTAATTSSPPAPAQPNNQPAANAPSIPAGFKDYQLSGTNLTFAAPLSWGSPTSAADPGYSKRAAGQQSDGTHAYLVNFATNKDIQLAITSSKYLPPARDAQYYDYLQWCTGTNDGQFYQSTLHFTTTAGTDTPSTIVCDQGPLTAAAKLDSKTLVQSRVANISGKLIGDIYTENLSDPSLVVIRVKDTAMTNAAAIKQLLGTIQFSNAQ